ncbi:hypothetical protein FB562_2046, partial [Homoserinimonas aerilata]
PPDLPATVSEPVRNLVYSCIAKSPAERPSSSAHLARAAQALRRGDVAGATAAVPGVAGAEAFTTLITPGVDTSAATRVLPSAAGGLGAAGGLSATQPMSAMDGPDEVKSRNPWTWPLIALVGILLVALIGVILALVFAPGDEPSQSSAPPSQTQSQKPSTTPSADNKVAVVQDDYLGMTEMEVRNALGLLDLRAEVVEGNTAPDPDSVGKVYKINPTGRLDPGSVVTATIYAPIPDPAKPAAPSASSSTAEPGDTVTITWPTYTGCAPGTNHTAYRLSLTGATTTAGNPLGKGQHSAEIVVDDGVTSVTVSYLAECSGIQSPPSDTVTITVTPPVSPPPSTDPGNGNGNGGGGAAPSA